MTRRTQKAMALIREQVQAAHQLLEETLGELPGEEIHWTPAGVAHPIGATYAHVVISEEGYIRKAYLPLFCFSHRIEVETIGLDDDARVRMEIQFGRTNEAHSLVHTHRHLHHVGRMRRFTQAAPSRHARRMHSFMSALPMP